MLDVSDWHMSNHKIENETWKKNSSLASRLVICDFHTYSCSWNQTQGQGKQTRPFCLFDAYPTLVRTQVLCLYLWCKENQPLDLSQQSCCLEWKAHACVLFVRCVTCCDCAATTPGVGCQWMSNYTQCGPCASKTTCPVCKIKYNTNDLMIQCAHCERYTSKLDSLR